MPRIKQVTFLTVEETAIDTQAQIPTLQETPQTASLQPLSRLQRIRFFGFEPNGSYRPPRTPLRDLLRNQTPVTMRTAKTTSHVDPINTLSRPGEGSLDSQSLAQIKRKLKDQIGLLHAYLDLKLKGDPDKLAFYTQATCCFSAQGELFELLNMNLASYCKNDELVTSEELLSDLQYLIPNIKNLPLSHLRMTFEKEPMLLEMVLHTDQIQLSIQYLLDFIEINLLPSRSQLSL